MALVECVECGRQISDRAEFCPHCGRPTENRMKPERYRLARGIVFRNRFAAFLKVVAIVVAIAGTIVSLLKGLGLDAGYYGTKFQFVPFIISLSGYAIYFFILWSMSTIVQMIQATHDMVIGLRLETQEDVPENGGTLAGQPTRYFRPRDNDPASNE